MLNRQYKRFAVAPMMDWTDSLNKPGV